MSGSVSDPFSMRGVEILRDETRRVSPFQRQRLIEAGWTEEQVDGLRTYRAAHIALWEIQQGGGHGQG